MEGAAKALERWRREGPSLPLVLEVGCRDRGCCRSCCHMQERNVTVSHPRVEGKVG